MAVRGRTVQVDSTTPVVVRPGDASRRPGMTLVISNPHSEQRHLLLGGPDLTASSNIGLEIAPGMSAYFDGILRYDDAIYCIAQSGTGMTFYVLEVGV